MSLFTNPTFQKNCIYVSSICSLIAILIFMSLEISSPQHLNPSHALFIATFAVWAVAVILSVLSRFMQQRFLTYIIIFLSLISLVTFTYFVVLNPEVYLIIILVGLYISNLLYILFTFCAVCYGVQLPEPLPIVSPTPA